MELADAEKADAATPTQETCGFLQVARDNYHERIGDVTSNSKLGEKFGEDASRYHVIPRFFWGGVASWCRQARTLALTPVPYLSISRSRRRRAQW